MTRNEAKGLLYSAFFESVANQIGMIDDLWTVITVLETTNPNIACYRACAGLLYSIAKQPEIKEDLINKWNILFPNNQLPTDVE